MSTLTREQVSIELNHLTRCPADEVRADTIRAHDASLRQRLAEMEAAHRYTKRLLEGRENECIELQAKVAALEQQYETEQLRLAACAAAALGWHKPNDPALQPEYNSAALQDTMRLYQNRIALEAKLTALEQELAAEREVRNICARTEQAQRERADLAENELCTANDQIPPDMEGDSLSVALIKLKDERRALKERAERLEKALKYVLEDCSGTHRTLSLHTLQVVKQALKEPGK